MKVSITGAAGFVGEKLSKYLLSSDSPIKITKLHLYDVKEPNNPTKDSRVFTHAIDIFDLNAADKIIESDTAIVYHLAAVVSGQAESDFDLGYRVNFDATRYLLEVARKKNPSLKFVFASTSIVYGGDLPPVVDDNLALNPQTSYGTAKSLCELIINDYTRRGFVDGVSVRLPAVCVRSGTANTAMTSFVSGIIREPLSNIEAICPVSKEQYILVTSPNTVVRNIAYAATLSKELIGYKKSICLPGVKVSVDDMIKALENVAGKKTSALVKFERDEAIAKIMATIPVEFDNTRALRLGFHVDKNFEEIIQHYIKDDLKACKK